MAGSNRVVSGDAATKLIQLALAEGLLDDLTAKSMLDLHFKSPSASLEPTARQATENLGKFILLEKIGEGGMGTVWKAWQSDLKRFVALKLIKGDDPDAVSRFIREAQTAAGLSHPNIVATYEAGEIEGRHFISMEFVAGDDLRKRRVDVRTALTLLRDVAHAVHYAHTHGIIHRDLKPTNLMLGDDGRVRVMDFGLAKSESAAGLSITGTVLGTPHYMPPEQAMGMPTDSRSDVYSLGATLYELVTGHAPFEGKDVYEILRAVTADDPTPPRRLNPGMDRDVETLILKAMEKDPGRRYSTAEEMAEDLQRLLSGEPISARPISLVGRLGRRARRHKAAAGLIGAAILTALGLTTTWTTRAVDEARLRRRAHDEFVAGRLSAAETAVNGALQYAPEDKALSDLLSRIRAAGESRRAADALERRRLATEQLRRVMESEAAIQEQVPLHTPPSRLGPLWSVEDESRGVQEECDRLKRKAEQAALSAIAHWSDDAEANRVMAELAYEQFEEAVENRNLPKQRLLAPIVTQYGGEPYRAKVEALGTLDLSTDPPGAEAYLFVYREVERRLLPVPINGDAPTPVSVDPLPIDASEEAKRLVRNATAYPLKFGKPVDFPLNLPPDQYLVVFRMQGRLDVRYPVHLKRSDVHRHKVRLPELDSVPSGFVFVPAGEFIAGEDPVVRQIGGARREGCVTVEEFIIGKFEVTSAEYIEYLNDREWHDAEGAAKRVPRRSPTDGPLWLAVDGRIELGQGWIADEPVGAISCSDGEDYAKWFTSRFGMGEWRFRLPTEVEWEKAARGTGGRYFVWGDRPVVTFCSMYDSRSPMPDSEPHGLFPADESPYGVRDMAGSVREMTSTTTGDAGRWRIYKGGTRGSPAESSRAATRSANSETVVYGLGGFRLAASMASSDF